LPQQARYEGVTETMGAVVLQATGNGTIPAGSSVTVVYGGTITKTSSLANLSGSFNSASCAGAGCVGNPFNNFTPPAGLAPGFTISASGNQLTIQFTGTQGATVNASSQMGFEAGDYLVVSQVRLNVNSLGSGTAGVIITVSAQMSGTSSFSSSNPITFTNSNVPVATATPPSLTVKVGAANSIQTCSIPISTFTVKITENYPAAITSISDETGFTPSVLPAPANGSQVVVTLAGVPAGMSVAFGTAGVPAGNSAQTVTGPTTFTLSSTTGTAIQTVPAGGGNLTWTFIAANGNDSTAVSETTTLNFTIGAVTSGAFTMNSPLPFRSDRR